VAALRERIAADGHQIEPDHAYVDKRYSGSIPVATALEQLRDAVAAGQIERVYVLAPDRLARRYAHQVLVTEEFRRPVGFASQGVILASNQRQRAAYVISRTRFVRENAPSAETRGLDNAAATGRAPSCIYATGRPFVQYSTADHPHYLTQETGLAACYR